LRLRQGKKIIHYKTFFALWQIPQNGFFGMPEIGMFIYDSNYKKISDFRPVSLWMKTRKATSTALEKLNKLNLL
jgi:hypothetical protein